MIATMERTAANREMNALLAREMRQQAKKALRYATQLATLGRFDEARTALADAKELNKAAARAERAAKKDN